MKRLILLTGMLLTLAMPASSEQEVAMILGYPTIEPWLGTGFYEWSPKYWYTYVRPEADAENVNLCYKMIGDSNVAGKTYSKIVLEYQTRKDMLEDDILLLVQNTPRDKAGYADTLLYRQEGDKVFCLSKANEEILLIDYGVSVGDTFTNAAGELFTVKETGYFKDEARDIEHWFYGVYPKMLRLISENTGQEDVWMEGIGSLNWGILPIYLAKETNAFHRLGINDADQKVIMAWCANMRSRVGIIEDTYKWVYFTEQTPYTGQDEAPYTDFSFRDDTLCVKGVLELNCYDTYAECITTGNRIDVKIKQVTPMDNADCLYERCFEARIPGFKAGTYEVGMAGEEHVTLQCNGPTGIQGVTDKRNDTDSDGIYDLSGRRATKNHGVYLRNGKKIIMK